MSHEPTRDGWKKRAAFEGAVVAAAIGLFALLLVTFFDLSVPLFSWIGAYERWQPHKFVNLLIVLTLGTFSVLWWRKLKQSVTERKKTEREFLTEKNKLQAVLKAMPSGVTIRNLDYELTYQNDYSLNLFGDRTGEKCYRVFHGINKICEGCPVELALKDGKTHTSVRKGTLPSGEISFWENVANPIRDATGKIIACLEVNTNITERKRTEEALMHSKTEWEATFNAMSDWVSLVDLKAQIRQTNHAAEEFVGMPADEIKGKVPCEMVHGTKERPAGCPLQKMLQTRQRESAELPGRNGNRCLMVTVDPVFDTDNNLEGAVHIVKDITKRKQAEEQLKQIADELRAEREELSEMNIVFKHIFEHLEEERHEYKQHICQDVEQAVIPVLSRLKKKADPAHTQGFETLEANLRAILAKDIDVFRERYAKLTPRELEVCEMIKDGLSSKEISDCLNLSLLTVHKHREEIRRKLGITNKRVSLGTYLLTR